MSLGVAYSNSATGVTGQSGPWTFTTWTLPTCNKLLVFIAIGDDTDHYPDSVSWNSAGMSLIGTVIDNSASPWCTVSAYYLDTPSVGNYTLSVGLTGSMTNIMAIGVALTDAETGAPAYSTNQGTGTPLSVTVAGSVNGDLVIGAICSDAGASITKGASLTEFFGRVTSLDSDTDLHGEYITATGANTVCDWSGGNEKWAALGVAVGGTGGAAGVILSNWRPMAGGMRDMG